jgi:hypothetical protein
VLGQGLAERHFSARREVSGQQRFTRANSGGEKGYQFMASTVHSLEERRMSVGRVFQRAFGTIAHNPLVVLGLALLIGAIPGLMVTMLFATFVFRGADAAASAATLAALSVAGLVSFMVSLVISALVQGALTRATIAENEGSKATFGESLSAGLRVILPLIGAGLIFAIGVAVGMIFLIVPGVILMLMWAVAAPAVVVERDGVFAALRRSRALTKGARWKILGVFLVLAVLYFLLVTVLGVVGLEAYGMGDASNGVAVSNMLGSIVLGTMFNVLWGTVQPSLYVELRHWKEGDDVDALRNVFA